MGFTLASVGLPLAQVKMSDPNAILFVDVGGGFSHGLLCTRIFHQKHPSAPRRLIVQGTPYSQCNSTVSYLPNWEKSSFMAHSFFAKQPIKDPNGFLTLSATTNSIQMQGRITVPQDRPDAEYRHILRHISDAMAPGYSKLLINEDIIPG